MAMLRRWFAYPLVRFGLGTGTNIAAAAPDVPVGSPAGFIFNAAANSGHVMTGL